MSVGLPTIGQNLFTCNSCMIQFRSSDMQRYHMKTDWHRYNLKRRIAELPPISADLFAEKLQISEREKELHDVDEFGFAVLKPRNSKSFEQREAYRKKSKNRGRQDGGVNLHSEVLRSLSPASSIASHVSKLSINSKTEIPTDFEEETVYDYGLTTDSNYTSDSDTSVSEYTIDEETERIPVTDCVFCGDRHEDTEKNVRHMFQSHGFYIPERSYLTDLPGLLNYFITLVTLHNKCPCCSFHGSSLESIRAHIYSKRHSRIPYETKEERAQYAQFYDFSSLKEDTIAFKSKGKKSVTFEDNVSESQESSDSDGDADTNISDSMDMNSNYTTVQMDNSGVELTLPTGARVGHRTMTRYYRQNLPGPVDPSEGNKTLAVGDRRFRGGVTQKAVVYGEKKAQQIEKRITNRQIQRQLKKR